MYWIEIGWIMEKNIPLLKVQMFGYEKIEYGEKALISGKKNITKAMKLLFILIYSGSAGIEKNSLIECLYGREELLDSSNNFRVTLHRLKKMLSDAGMPEHEYIVLKNGRYYWDCPMDMYVDVHEFKKLIHESQNEEDVEKKILIMKKACEIYDVRFFEKFSDDEWVIMESMQYKRMYSDVLEELCELLMERREYSETLKVVDPACEFYPFDEWQTIKIDCYIALNRYKDALKEYENTAKLLFEELGVSPSEKMIKQFKIMSEHISNRPQIITEIKSNLEEKKEEKGAFFCTVPGFRDAYRIVRRGMERNGQSVYLMVCTLVDSKGNPMESSDKLEIMSEKLFFTIKNSLRRSDSFTKYNQSQYLILLMGINKENCQIISDRIRRAFSREHKSWEKYLNCMVSSLYDFKEVEGKAHLKFLND